MRYEGYWQMWCPEGHSWNLPEDYGMGLSRDDLHCDICGAKRAAYNSVDDTNCDQWGHLHGFNDKLPEDPVFIEDVGNAHPEEQPGMWKWAVSC